MSNVSDRRLQLPFSSRALFVLVGLFSITGGVYAVYEIQRLGLLMLVLAVMSGFLGFRAFVMGAFGLTISGKQLIVRGGARTHRISFLDVASVEVLPKDMLGNGLVCITTVAGRVIPINGVIGARAHAMAAALRSHIDESLENGGG